MKSGLTIRSVLILALVMLGLSQPTQAREDTELDGTPLGSDIASAFESNWRKYARFACKIGDTYGYIPSYQRRFDSSLGKTTTQYMEENKTVEEVRNGNFVRKRQVTYKREDAQAFVRSIPDLKIGSYGYIASAEVVKVINNNEMIVTNLWLVDQDTLREAYASDLEKLERKMDEKEAKKQVTFDYQLRIQLKELQDSSRAGFEGTFRLVGFETRGLRQGDRWAGPNNKGFQVGVIRWEQPEEPEDKKSRFRRTSRDARLLLSTLEEPMRQSVDAKGFKQLLAEREMTVKEFVDLVRVLRERDRKNAEERIINALLPPTLTEED